MSGHWPPEWEDPGEEFFEEADQTDATVSAEASEARLSEVAAYLASVPVPALPEAVEMRISAALAAEAASRADRATAPADQTAAQPDRVPALTDGARTVGPSRGQKRVRRDRGGDRPRRGFRLRPLAAAGALVACLLFAGLGYAIAQSHTTTESANSSAATGSGTAASSAEAGPEPAAAASAAGAQGPEAGNSSTSFTVTTSGTKYQQVTLAEQVRAKLPAHGGQETFAGTSPHSTSTAAVPNPALRGCVLHLTGGAPPRLVDRATYQDEPAYIVASSTRVWVVGLGCTAAKTELIVSVALAGLPGNLRALVSVEQ
ncbi:MAG: hypothetical protein ACRDP7_34490 [Trebonia sp.]